MVVTPVEPVAPVPPIDQLRLYVAPDGVVRSSFAGKVTATGGNATKGYSLTLISTDRTDEGDLCLIDASGLSELAVAKGQSVVRAQPVGKHRNGIGFSVRVECSDNIDAASPTKLSDAPPPPAPPEPVDAVSPVAPVAPPAPMAALAPLLPSMIAQMAPPARYRPTSMTAMVAPTPPTPVTPVTPVTPATPPPALDGAGSNGQ